MSELPVERVPILQVRDLCVEYELPDHTRVKAVEKISFDLHEGELLGLVGESGCGKTTLILALLRLLPLAGRITRGQVVFNGMDLLALSEREMEDVRWNSISIVFQGAMNALNPVRSIGFQIAEAIYRHEVNIPRQAVEQRVDDLLDLVGIPPERKKQYPFQFSGGMRQRVMIAMALACSPQILIADEPTTALDVMIQAQILELLLTLRKKLGLAVILVTHDLGVIAEVSDTVLVMYGGVVAEYAGVHRLYNAPAHPYTQNLLQAFPDLSNPSGKLISIPGYPPRLEALPVGCRFAPRCQKAFDRCRAEQPGQYTVEKDHRASCFLLEVER